MNSSLLPYLVTVYQHILNKDIILLQGKISKKKRYPIPLPTGMLYNVEDKTDGKDSYAYMNDIIPANILIIEDDKFLAEGLMRALTSGQTLAKSCGSLKEARIQLQTNTYALILLDLNLPDGNGFDFLTEIKTQYKIPVIILTANDLESDIVAGLENGADDYITKPFSLAVLRARVQTQLRKLPPADSPFQTGQPYTFGDYLFDFEKMQFLHAGISIELSKTEQRLLHILTENVGITLPRERLIDYVWTDGAEYVEDNALYVTMKRLRDKLDAQDYIETVYGIGYVFHPKKKSERQE